MRSARVARPAQIVDAALEVFAERGLAAARLDDIARRAGVAKGTIYSYFPNKEALFQAVIRGMVVSQIESGAIQCIAVDTPIPSVFSHEILNSHPYAYLDDAPLEERRARAVEMRRVLPAAVLDEVGHLDPAAISEVKQDAWPDVRDADELHDALLTLIAIPEDLRDWRRPNPVNHWGSWFDKLRFTGRATRVFDEERGSTRA